LTKIVYILFILIGINFTSFAQNKIAPGDPAATAKMIRFYPNPASSVITFEFLRAYDNSYSLQVYNFMGKKVHDIKKTPSRITLNLDDYYRGIYIFQLRDKNGSIIQSGKFQVVK
jgi:hypothetical protein